MKKILFTLIILFIFIFCKTENKKGNKNFILPENNTTKMAAVQSFIPQLPALLEENSGIILYNNLLWTFNDSGGENKIFAVDFKGKIQKTITVENSTNVDWEDIAQDKKFIYLADAGNNNGVRSNQKIYRIKKKELNNYPTQNVKADEISFSYNDQESFDFMPLQTEYDCEAMVHFNNRLFLFTKNWVDKTTSVYPVSKNKGDYELSISEKFNVNALVTGADISPDKTRLALIGYKDYNPILWVFSGIINTSFFEGDKMYFELDTIFNAQTEGICFKGNDTLLISCERTADFQQQVFLIDLKSTL